jgi:hypothetical protein
MPTGITQGGLLQRNVACKGETKNAHRVLVGNPEGQKKIGSRSCRWEDNIKTVVK